MGVHTLGNIREKAQANKGATWAMAVAVAVILVLVALGYSDRYNYTKTNIDYVNP